MSSLVRSTAVMSVGTVLSRITGLARLAAITAAIGVAETRLADSYNFANTTPNIIYELVLGGVLTSVFVPVFVELLEKEGRERAWQVASAIINLSLVVLMAITALGIVAAPLIARFFQPPGGADAIAQREVVTFLLRLFIPQIIFYGLTAITAGLLNAHKRFGPPMYTPILNNLAVIAVFIAFHQAYPDIPNDLDRITTTQLWIIGLGTTAGIALMAMAQLPFLRGLGRYRLTLSWRHPSVRKLAVLSVFVIGYVVTNQIGYSVVLFLAKGEEGGYSAYVAAWTFFMLPHGLVAVSIITALLPSMSEHAANARLNDFRERLSTGVRTTALLIFPAAVGYLVLGEPIVQILLQRGVMTSESTELVAGVLQFFTFGLLPFSLFQLLLRAFYALQDTKTPFLINCGATAVNIAVNVPMFAWLGVRGLAAGHAIAYVFGVSVQATVLSRRIGGVDAAVVGRAVGRIFLAAAGMGAVVYGTSRIFEGLLDGTLLEQLVALSASIAIGVVAYLGLSYAIGVEELAYARALVSGRFRRK